MPQPNTHYLVAKEAFANAQDIWRHYSNFAALGSFGPDLFYLLGVPHVIHSRNYPKDYTKVSDVLHWEASLDFFCSMLDYAKARMRGGASKDEIDKMKAFAYGYYSHAVADSVFHPFVYRRTGDNWTEHFAIGYDGHKRLERLIDTYLLGRREGQNPFTFGYPRKIECHKQNSGRALDEDIFSLLHYSIAQIYGRNGIFERHGIDYPRFFGQDAQDERHPIREAYRDCIGAFRDLYLFGQFLPQRLHPLIPIASLDAQELREVDPMPKRKWHPADNPLMPDYSVTELFDFSVKAMKKIIDAGERFFSSAAASARNFFSQEARNVVFLDEDYNLDTGLPSASNPDLIRLPRLEETFEFELEKLDANYRTIEAYVASS